MRRAAPAGGVKGLQWVHGISDQSSILTRLVGYGTCIKTDMARVCIKYVMPDNHTYRA